MDSYAAWAEQLQQSGLMLIGRVISYLPSLLAALALLVVGWLVARLLKALSVRLLVGADRLWHRFVTRTSIPSTHLRRPSSKTVGSLVFWLVMLFFLTAAADILGVKVFAEWLTKVVAYLPALIAGVVILLAGVFIGNLARDLTEAAAESAGISQAEFLGRGVQMAILGTALLIGAEQIGIQVSFLTGILTVLVAAVLGGAALAFGLGARFYVSNLIAARGLRQTLEIGQRVRIQALEGVVLEITATAVRLQAEKAEHCIPAHLFELHSAELLQSGQ
jgi:small-conductance mechanosensitive channel